MYDVQEELEDRFGDIPACVQNLMNIALLKADAQRACIVLLSVRKGIATLKIAPGAPIEGEEFVALLTEYRECASVMRDKPVITLRQKGKELEEMMNIAQSFVQKLFICIH